MQKGMAPAIMNWRTRMERRSGVYEGGGLGQCFYIKLTKLSQCSRESLEEATPGTSSEAYLLGIFGNVYLMRIITCLALWRLLTDTTVQMI